MKKKDKAWERHLKRIARQQAEINGRESRGEYTGEKIQVRGPGIGVAGVRELMRGNREG